MAIPGITDSLIATIFWAAGKWSWNTLNDPLKKAIQESDKYFKGKGLPFPVSRIEIILEAKVNPDKVKVFQKIESFTDSKSLAIALLDFENTSLKEVPENLTNAILFVDYFKGAFSQHLSANEKYAHQALANLVQIDLQLNREGRDKIIAEIQTITEALPRISEDTRTSREILERIEQKIQTATPPPKPHISEPKVFISYSRKDGETFAKELRLKLEIQNIPLWQDRVGMEGGKDWWLQIVEALNKVEFMVLIMTPKAMESDIIRKEWRYARQKGVCVYPVKSVPDEKLDYDILPRWMKRAHFYDLDHEWDKFINDLNTRCQEPRVPFMVEDLPKNFVQRPEQYNALRNQLLDAQREEPLAIATALRGAGGFGKTTLAMALCHDERIQDAYDDGILWVTIGEEPGDITEKIKNFIETLSGRRPGFTDKETASAHLSELLADRDILIVIDDVWDKSHIQPFLRGGPRCSRLITTRNSDTLPTGTKNNILDAMRNDEARNLLAYGLPAIQKEELQNLSKRLGKWPLVLKLANAFLIERVVSQGQALPNAIAYILKRLDKYGITAFDVRETKVRDQAVEATLSVSLELLSEDEKQRFAELAVFPEDIDIPLETIDRLWSHAGFDELDTEGLCERLFRFSLLQRFDPSIRVIRLHDVIRGYLRLKNRQQLNQMQTKFLKSYGVDQWPELPPYEPYLWQHLAFHLSDGDQAETLHHLLCDYHWIRRKLTHGDVNALLADYGHLPEDKELALIQSALRLSANPITSDPNQITPQLLGRLMGIEGSPDTQRLLGNATKEQKACWLRPTTMSLITAGGPLLRTFEGHCNYVAAVTFSPDGKTIVSGSGDKTLKLWDVSTGQVLRTFKGHNDGVSAVAFSSDGKIIVSGSFDKTLKLWDVSTGQAMRTFKGGHSFSVSAVAFSPDGKTIVSGSLDSTLKLWDVSTGQALRTFKSHSGSVNAVAFSPDGKTIVSGSRDNTLKLWNVSTTQVVRTFKGHRTDVNAVAFSPDGKTVVSGSRDNTLKLWDVSKSQEVRTFKGHSDLVRTVAFNHDGKTVVSGSNDTTLKLWDVTTGQALRTFEGHGSPVIAIALSPDGKTIVSGSGENALKLWEVSTGQALRSIDGSMGRFMAVASSPDGKTIVSSSSDNTLKLWDVSTAQVVRTFEGHCYFVTAVAFSPDGKTIVSNSGENTLELWDVTTGQMVRTFEGHGAPVRTIAYSPDSKTIVSGSSDNTLKLWDVSTGQIVRTFEGYGEEVIAVAFSPDGKTVVFSVIEDRALKLWNVSTGQVVRTFEGHGEDVTAVAFSPDGKTIVSGSGDNTLKLWDVTTGQMVRTFEGHSAPVIALSLSSDGKSIVSSSRDNTLRLWDVSTGNMDASFYADSLIASLTFVPSSMTIVASELRGCIHFLRIVGFIPTKR